MPHATDRIAENVALIAVARVSMALSLPALGLVAYLFNANLEQKFAAQDSKIVAQATASENQSRIVTARVETVERVAQAAIEQGGAVNGRLSIVETKQNESTISNEKFQTGVLTRLDRTQDALVGLSNAVSALTATVQSGLEARRNQSPQ